MTELRGEEGGQSLILAMRHGLVTLAQASIVGSVIGNASLVVGMALFYGGLRNGIQSFSREEVGHPAPRCRVIPALDNSWELWDDHLTCSPGSAPEIALPSFGHGLKTRR